MKRLANVWRHMRPNRDDACVVLGLRTKIGQVGNTCLDEHALLLRKRLGLAQPNGGLVDGQNLVSPLGHEDRVPPLALGETKHGPLRQALDRIAQKVVGLRPIGEPLLSVTIVPHVAGYAICSAMAGSNLVRRHGARSLLSELLEFEDLGSAIRRIAPAQFPALIKSIGLEDAGEIMAFATVEQLVAASDELLFEGPRPGEAERFNPATFLTWLEILSEAGDEVAALRLLEMGEEFATCAISSVLWVIDAASIERRVRASSELGDALDKALDSCPYEEIEGYLLVGKSEGGWEALLNTVLALDRLDRRSLTCLLDRCCDMQSEHLEDLGHFIDLLSDEESLSEDIEEEREARRAALGYVEPRAARAFLHGCAQTYATGRDPLTKRYFSNLGVAAPAKFERAALHAGDDTLASRATRSHTQFSTRSLQDCFAEVFAIWQQTCPPLASERLEELTYLTNVLIAGAEREGRAFALDEASRAVLATVAHGASLECSNPAASRIESLRLALEQTPADVLFRRAAYDLCKTGRCHASRSWLNDESELN